jgi:hypothetical protein
MVVRAAGECDSPTSLVNGRRGRGAGYKRRVGCDGYGTQLRGAHIANYSFAFY